MKKNFLWLLLLLPVSALAQYSVWSEPIINNLGQPMVGAGVVVCGGSVQPSLVVPCGGSSLATIYSSFGGGAQVNPLFTDQNGFAPIYATSGNYWIQVYGSGIQTTVIPISIGGGSGSGSGTVNIGTVNCSAYYPASTAAVSAQCGLMWNGLLASFSSSVSTASDGIHAGSIQLTGNTTVPGLGANTFSMIGPNAASMTPYALQFPSTPPTNGQVPTAGTASGGISPISWATPSSSGITGSGTAGTFMAWATSSTAGNAPCTFTAANINCTTTNGPLAQVVLNATATGNTSGNHSWTLLDGASGDSIFGVPAGSSSVGNPSGVSIVYPVGSGFFLNPGTPSALNCDSVGFCTFGGTITAPFVKAKPATFSAAGSCSGAEGVLTAITDSTTNTWGATVTGGGANHILMYCDGTNWTVAAK
jgi:hypothetical protein